MLGTTLAVIARARRIGELAQRTLMRPGLQVAIEAYAKHWEEQRKVMRNVGRTHPGGGLRSDQHTP